MNGPIARLFVVVCLLFAILVAWTSRWTVFEASSLRANTLNRRPLLEAQRIRRGAILAADGTVLARSYKDAAGIYHRTYPQGGLFANGIGYAFARYGTAGLEAYRNDALTGKLDSTQLNSIVDQLTGRKPVGDDIITTLDPAAQRVALQGLGGQPGAVVALDPRSGAIKVFASVPGYNPNQIAVPGRFAALNSQPGSPLFDRVTQSGYPPGSTFKVVTAIAAIDSGRYTPDSVVNGDSPKMISGVPLMNDFNQSWGDISLTDALTHSVNTVWAQVGVALGKPTMQHYMNALGFDRKPPIDLPANERRASGEYPRGRLTPPVSPLVDVGRMAIGQDNLEVTPLQMAMVAAAVGNGGRVMEPHITDRILDRDGRIVDRVQPTALGQAMSAQTAASVGQMMTRVVQEGTGTAAALSGIQVAGKTGTAQTSQPGLSQVWFIAFAPVVNPRVAVAVTVERSSGEGGTVAAPIAKQVMQTLLGSGG